MKFDNKKIIKTDRLTLKRYSLFDLKEYVLIILDKEDTNTYMVPDFKNDEAAIEFAKRILSSNKDRLELGIYKDEKLIGWINECESDDSSIELGYIINSRYKGNGYATEALKAVISYLFELGYISIRCAYFSNNIASKRVMEKCEMENMNYSEIITYRNEERTCIYYQITNAK